MPSPAQDREPSDPPRPSETGEPEPGLPPAHNPTRKASVIAWVRARAARDLERPS